MSKYSILANRKKRGSAQPQADTAATPGRAGTEGPIGPIGLNSPNGPNGQKGNAKPALPENALNQALRAAGQRVSRLIQRWREDSDKSREQLDAELEAAVLEGLPEGQDKSQFGRGIYPAYGTIVRIEDPTLDYGEKATLRSLVLLAYATGHTLADLAAQVDATLAHHLGIEVKRANGHTSRRTQEQILLHNYRLLPAARQAEIAAYVDIVARMTNPQAAQQTQDGLPGPAQSEQTVLDASLDASLGKLRGWAEQQDGAETTPEIPIWRASNS